MITVIDSTTNPRIVDARFYFIENDSEINHIMQMAETLSRRAVNLAKIAEYFLRERDDNDSFEVVTGFEVIKEISDSWSGIDEATKKALSLIQRANSTPNFDEESLIHLNVFGAEITENLNTFSKLMKDIEENRLHYKSLGFKVGRV